MNYKYLIFGMIFLVSCTAGNTVTVDDGTNVEDNMAEDMDADMADSKMTAPAWASMELKDVSSSETYTVSELLADGPVLIETFAVWCPVCKRQQKEVKKFHETNKNVHSVSIDIDANEDEEKVKAYIMENGFDWKYSISNDDYTRALIEDFGTTVISTSSAPVILVCDETHARLLKRGVKLSSELESEVAAGC